MSKSIGKPTSTAIVRRTPDLAIRTMRFEDVAEILRVVSRAVAADCREHYDTQQRAAVYEAYATALFVDALGPFENVAAELDGRIVAFAQLDPADGRLRALFVDADCQRRGVGRALLADVEARAIERGRARLHGAMSLNAVPFYERAGFRAGGAAVPLMTTGAGLAVGVPIVRMEKRLRA
jgi:putative acetyltransferase